MQTQMSMKNINNKNNLGSEIESCGKVVKDAKLKEDMRLLWLEHVFWTRLYIISALEGLGNTKQTLDRLMKNQGDIASALGSIYGKEVEKDTKMYLEQHISIAGDLISAAAIQSKTPTLNGKIKVEKLKQDWFRNADEIVSYFCKIIYALDCNAFQSLMYIHLDMTLKEALAHIGKKWQDEIKTYDKVQEHVLEMSDLLSFAISQGENNAYSLKSKLKNNNNGNNNNGVLDLEEWVDFAKEKCGLTISDIEKLKKGEKIKVALLDRNYGDMADNFNKKGKVYDPKIFFIHGWAIYEHGDEMNGKIYWDFGEDRDFEFDVEYSPDSWYPFENGYLPKKWQMGESPFGKKVNWREFPKDTHVGWRGAMIPWDCLSSLPKIHYVYSFDEEDENGKEESVDSCDSD